MHGQKWGIFLENGLVGLVTAYHKGYHMTGTTALIHRYLPKQVSEILVRYLWLVQPFQQQLRTLALMDTSPPSPVGLVALVVTGQAKHSAGGPKRLSMWILPLQTTRMLRARLPNGTFGWKGSRGNIQSLFI
jgi:hypothetical protein